VRARLSQAAAGARGPCRRAIALGLGPGRPPDVPAGRARPVAGAPPHAHGCPIPSSARGRPWVAGVAPRHGPAGGRRALAHNQPPRSPPEATHAATPHTACGWWRTALVGVARLCGGERLCSVAPPAFVLLPSPNSLLHTRCPPLTPPLPLLSLHQPYQHRGYRPRRLRQVDHHRPLDLQAGRCAPQASPLPPCSAPLGDLGARRRDLCPLGAVTCCTRCDDVGARGP
jgi:hypothetical protein